MQKSASFYLKDGRPARTLAVRFSEFREDQIARTTEQRALRAEFAGSAVLI